ncbi:MAG: hypothetical protein J5803_01170 [Desulfovibrio sp.]|nr:hypothetical protein [Desulfovibrio sp.]
MQEKKKTQIENQDLFAEIGTEVGQESAPLLEFITKHGSKIATCVLVFVLITAGVALWQWHSKKERNAYLEEMSTISLRLTGPEKVKALADLVEKAPKELRTFSWMALGDIATQNQDGELAIKAYSEAAKSDADGITGTMAALAEASSLLRNNKNSEALTLLQTLSARYGQDIPLAIRQLMADAAQRSGDTALASKILAEMATQLTGDDAAFIKSRSEALALAAEDKAAKTNEAKTEKAK